MSTTAQVAEALAGTKVRPYGGNFLTKCPAHTDDTPSLSLRDSGSGLVVHCFSGCSARDVYAAIRRVSRLLDEPRAIAPEPAPNSSEWHRRQHDKATWIWSQRQPVRGSIAERYLRSARGITCELPATIGFLPPRGEHPPALICAFASAGEPEEPGLLAAPRSVRAVHLIKLRTDGSDKVDTKPKKITIGRPLGQPIVLAPPNDLLGLAITEGIEDALTAHEATGLGAWAAGSGAMMPALADAVPDYIETVTVFADDDRSGQDNARKLATAIRRRLNSIEILIEGLAS
jgi:hypothetical protein